MAAAGRARAKAAKGDRAASAEPDKRILELLLLLLNADGPLPRSEIFAAIPGYRTGKPAAGERKFERDKKDLRELGVPLEEVDPDEHSYAVRRRAYALPPVDLDAEERAALLLAAEAVFFDIAGGDAGSTRTDIPSRKRSMRSARLPPRRNIEEVRTRAVISGP